MATARNSHLASTHRYQLALAWCGQQALAQVRFVADLGGLPLERRCPTITPAIPGVTAPAVRKQRERRGAGRSTRIRSPRGDTSPTCLRRSRHPRCRDDAVRTRGTTAAIRHSDVLPAARGMREYGYPRRLFGDAVSADARRDSIPNENSSTGSRTCRTPPGKPLPRPSEPAFTLLFVTVTNSRVTTGIQLVLIDGELEVATDAFTAAAAADTPPAGPERRESTATSAAFEKGRVVNTNFARGRAAGLVAR